MRASCDAAGARREELLLLLLPAGARSVDRSIPGLFWGSMEVGQSMSLKGCLGRMGITPNTKPRAKGRGLCFGPSSPRCVEGQRHQSSCETRLFEPFPDKALRENNPSRPSSQARRPGATSSMVVAV